MPIITETITALDGSFPAKGWVEFTVDNTRQKSTGSGVITPRTVIVPISKTTGAMTSPNLDPGPATVRIVAGDRDATYSIVIPETAATLWELIEIYNPPAGATVYGATFDAATDLAVSTFVEGSGPTAAALNATYATHKNLARNPDLLIAGTITRDTTTGAATSAPVVWPDGSPGTYTATTLSTAFPGAVDAYTITYGSPVTKTFTQPAVTRNADGAPTAVPAIVVS